jgi:hypothetical protein
MMTFSRKVGRVTLERRSGNEQNVDEGGEVDS